MKKLGLDLGSSSIGWFLRDGDDILKYGSVIFDSGMTKGTSGYSSPTKDRREYRLKRNPIKARKYRKTLILKTLLKKQMVPLSNTELSNWSDYKKGQTKKFPNNNDFKKWLNCDFSFNNGEIYKNPYELRVKALSEELTPFELGRTLYHLTQRRGFKDIGETNKETQKQIDRRKESGFQEALTKHPTIGVALQKEYLEKNIRARDNYPYRDEYEAELFKILSKQGFSLEVNSDNKFVCEFVSNVHKAIIWQQPLKTQKGNIGKCTLEPKKRRCALSHPLFEISRALQFINTIKSKEKEGSDFKSIPQDFREILYKSIFLKESANFKFEKIRKALDKLFKKKMIYNYRLDQRKGTYESTVAGMPFCKGVIKIFGNQAKEDLLNIESYTQTTMPKNYQGYSILDIWHNVAEFDEEKLSEFGVEKLNLEFEMRKRKGKIVAVSPLKTLRDTLPNGYGNLSQFVLRKIIPLLKQGYLYNDAVLLANLKEALGDNYKLHKAKVHSILSEATATYKKEKTINTITNKLIENYKAEIEANLNGKDNERFAQGDFNYTIKESDYEAIITACEGHFGANKWKDKVDKDEITDAVGNEYQEFFFDNRRSFRKLRTQQEIFENSLNNSNISLNKSLYHHSNRDNIYGSTITFRDTEIEILPLAQTPSIKNPMFNKAMSILRKLINALITEGLIDKDSEIIVEVARELNDNNKRIAIERFQKQREAKRNKIRAFLEEYRTNEKPTLNIEESLGQFELWDEQIFEETIDEYGNNKQNIDRKVILKENNAIKRYELWMEQKGQCMYTGKMISISQLFSSSINIEHTIARDLLPDNTMANKTIAFRDYNTNIKKTELPIYLPNFLKDIADIGTAITPRLDQWIKIRDDFEKRFKSRQKPNGAEDENIKNQRIQDKHFYKMHFDYWKEKLERFTTTDISDKWVRRQLTDTQNISKYAREFLKTYFYKVSVQKGSTTAEFRKMLGLEDKENPKDRALHTHHTLDAAVLTYIPTNASRRDRLIKKSYALKEKSNNQFHFTPHSKFNAQKVKEKINNNTLIYNYTKDNISTQTFKKVRKAGKIQYKKDASGNNIIKEPIMSGGDTIRKSLFADSFLGKIRDVERFEDGKPRRNATNTDWIYKKGNDEFIYVKREPIEKITQAKIKDIVDPSLAKKIESQLGNKVILDWQGNTIRHVRIKKKAGKRVKERVNYKSDKNYKNYFYAESGSIPYGIMLFNPSSNERVLLQVHSYQVAEVFRLKRKFDIELFVNKYHPQYSKYEKLLLKVGQRLIVLNNDDEFEKRFNKDFLKNRLYKISKFDNGSLWLEYHLNAIADGDLDSLVKNKKNELLWTYERNLGLNEVVKDESIKNLKERNEDYERRKFKLNSYDDYRIKRIVDNFGKEKATEIKKELGKFKKVSSFVEAEGETPLLKLNTSESWNFLYEKRDFDTSILGEIKFK